MMEAQTGLKDGTYRSNEKDRLDLNGDYILKN